jgi:hypothetical protein
VSAAEGVANIIDQLFETDDEKQPAEIIKAKMMKQPSLTQICLSCIVKVNGLDAELGGS